MRSWAGNEVPVQDCGSRGVAPLRQPPLEQVTPPSQPAAHRPDRTAQLLGRLVVSSRLEVTQHERRTILSRQSIQFLVEHRADLQKFRRLGAAASIQVRDAPSPGPGRRIVFVLARTATR